MHNFQVLREIVSDTYECPKPSNYLGHPDGGDGIVSVKSTLYGDVAKHVGSYRTELLQAPGRSSCDASGRGVYLAGAYGHQPYKTDVIKAHYWVACQLRAGIFGGQALTPIIPLHSHFLAEHMQTYKVADPGVSWLVDDMTLMEAASYLFRIFYPWQPAEEQYSTGTDLECYRAAVKQMPTFHLHLGGDINDLSTLHISRFDRVLYPIYSD